MLILASRLVEIGSPESVPCKCFSSCTHRSPAPHVALETYSLAATGGSTKAVPSAFTFCMSDVRQIPSRPQGQFDIRQAVPKQCQSCGRSADLMQKASSGLVAWPMLNSSTKTIKKTCCTNDALWTEYCLHLASPSAGLLGLSWRLFPQKRRQALLSKPMKAIMAEPVTARFSAAPADFPEGPRETC